MNVRAAVLVRFLMLAALAVSSCSPGEDAKSKDSSAPPKIAVPLVATDEVDFADIEAAALNSCLCRRQGKSDEQCAPIYEDERDDLLSTIYGGAEVEPQGVEASACAPISDTVECFEFTDGTKCIGLGFDVVVASRDLQPGEVCTVDEARAIEAAFNEGGNAAVDALLARILSGASIAPQEPSDGCAG